MKRTLVFTAVLAVAAATTTTVAQPWWRGRSAAATQPATVTAVAAADATTRPAMRFRGGRGAMMARGRSGGPGAADMVAIRSLVGAHQRITRTVEEVPGGVMTLTTSEDQRVAVLLRIHVAQIKRRMAEGRPIRMWDPLFVELFAQREKVTMTSEDVPGGVKVVATSEDPRVTMLIRQHATAGVSEFVRYGWDRVHEPTTLPGGYVNPK